MYNTDVDTQIIILICYVIYYETEERWLIKSFSMKGLV